MSAETRSWTTKSLDYLEHLYWTEIATALRADGYDPHEEHPPYRWLVENGYSGMIRSLRRDHGLTPTEFYIDVIGIEPDDEPYWPDVDEETEEALDRFVDNELRKRRGHPETTVTTVRSRLKRYVSTYVDLHERGDLVGRVRDRSEESDERRRVMAVFDILDEELTTDASTYKYVEAATDWYDYLELDEAIAVFNPATRVAKRLRLRRGKPDNRALEPDQVGELYERCLNDREQLVVLGLAGWGLRTSEVASLHVDQIYLDPDDDDRPYLAFEERKNGPGTVSLLVGVEVLQHRLDELAGRDDWSGYLFPSTQSTTGHRSPDTIRRRFSDVADRADVFVDGRRPTPKMGRRFWYSHYTEAMRQLLKRLEGIAEDQGSSSAGVVLENYLSEADRRRQRRDAMASALEDAFGGLLSDTAGNL